MPCITSINNDNDNDNNNNNNNTETHSVHLLTFLYISVPLTLSQPTLYHHWPTIPPLLPYSFPLAGWWLSYSYRCFLPPSEIMFVSVVTNVAFSCSAKTPDMKHPERVLQVTGTEVLKTHKTGTLQGKLGRMVPCQCKNMCIVNLIPRMKKMTSSPGLILR
jgi:hypothetical protein